MHTFLRKHWFLLVLLLGVCVTVSWTETVQTLLRPLPQQPIVACMLFLMAWSLESRKLWAALQRRRPVFLALAITYGLLPLLGWIIGPLFPIIDYDLGILVCTTVPCTFATAIIWTRLAGGDEAVALLVTVAAACTSWLITTTWLHFTTGTQVELNVPEMMLGLVFLLIVPVALGQLARWPTKLRNVAIRGRTAISVITRFLVLTVVLQAVALVTEKLQAVDLGEHMPILVGVAVAVLGIHLSGVAVGYWGGWLLGLDRAQRIAVAFAGSQKTLPVGLLLINKYYGNYALAIVPMLFYHVGQVLADTFLADLLRRTDQDTGIHGGTGIRVHPR